MEGIEDVSWTPTLVGMMDELMLYIYSLSDAMSIYYMAWSCRRFQRLAKTKSIKLARRLQERAIIQLRKDNYVEALIAFNRILALFPNSYKAWRKRSDCFSHTYEYAAAYFDLVRALQCCTKPAKQQLILSSMYCMEGKNQLAWEAANTAVQLDPGNPRYYHQRAYVQASLSTAGDEEAEQRELADYFKILDMHYDAKYMVQNNIGYTYFLRQEDDRADKHFTQALEGCPYFIKARINRADLRFFTNQFDASLADCDAVIAINPSFYEAYWLKGSNYFNRQEFGKAFRAYHTAFHLCEFYNEQVVLPFLGLGVKLGKIDMCFEEMRLLLAFYEQHAQVAERQISALEALLADPAPAHSECVTQLAAQVIHSRELKSAYYCAMFQRNIANRDWLVIAEPFAARHVTSLLTLIKRKVSGHYAIYELVLLKYLELCYLTGAFEHAEQARLKLLALSEAAHYTKKDSERVYHVLEFVREIDVAQVSATALQIAREMMQRAIVTTYDVDDYMFEELRQKHAQHPLPSVHDAKYLLLVFTYKTLTMRIHDPEPLGFNFNSTMHLTAAFKKLNGLSLKNKLMSAHQLIVEYEFQDTSV